jgi:hypothetical protein
METAKVEMVAITKSKTNLKEVFFLSGPFWTHLASRFQKSAESDLNIFF